MKITVLGTMFALVTLAFVPQIIFAEDIKLSPEEIQQQQDKLKLAQDQRKYQAFIPKSYVLFEPAIEGDLNKDGRLDKVLIIKATDPSKWVNDEYRGELDRNRRGIIVLLNDNGQYKKFVQNLDCFSSENEDGGVYYAPELWIEIEKNLLNIQYAHGRYGYWRYRFRVQDNDLRLIGYDDSSHHGPYVQSETSINFLTGRKVYRKNMNEDYSSEEIRFKETWQDIDIAPIYLSQISDFDEMSF